ncbi:MAG: T9SS type A sorting domain-containing protein, partial [Flavobacteriales bacterium]
NGNYPNNNTNRITLSNPLSLANCAFASVGFWARWEIEPGYDYVEFEASNDNGNTWTPLCGNYTKPGSPNQDQDEPLYDGFQLNWVYENVSLNDYLGQTILLRFKLVSDFWTKEDGFYFDDLAVTTVLNTGTTEANEVSTISIHPNPASDEVLITAGGLGDEAVCHIIMRDMLGRAVLRENVNIRGHIASLNVAHLPQGLYCLEISSDKIFEVRQLLVSRK